MENSITNERSSIEEYIKILENMNDGYTFKDCDMCNNYNEKTKCCDKYKCMELQAIDNLLSDYKRVLKENEELKNQEETARRINELLVQRYSNSIPVQKVKDNIEKLKAQYKTALEKNSTEAFILKCQITILQELLESEE